MTVFNETLKPFLNKLSAWIADGCKEDERFDKSSGLCRNYEKYLRSECYSYRKTFEAGRNLNELFASEGLNYSYPFNDKDYFIEIVDGTIFKNERRLAWIESHK